MGSAATGELFTQEQYEAMSPAERDRLDLVPLNKSESERLAPLPPAERREWIKKNKKAELRKKHKVERQRRKAGRR
jgi:hypothetical protein